MRVAVSTEDGKSLTNDHFGEGKFFLIYEISRDGYKLLEKRKNTSPEEEEHGSEIKARGIISILNDVPTLLGVQFGPNIMRIKEKFLPIVSREREIKRALSLLVKNYDSLKKMKDSRNIVLILDENGLRKVSIKNGKGF